MSDQERRILDQVREGFTAGPDEDGVLNSVLAQARERAAERGTAASSGRLASSWRLRPVIPAAVAVAIVAIVAASLLTTDLRTPSSALIIRRAMASITARPPIGTVAYRETTTQFWSTNADSGATTTQLRREKTWRRWDDTEWRHETLAPSDEGTGTVASVEILANGCLVSIQPSTTDSPRPTVDVSVPGDVSARRDLSMVTLGHIAGTRCQDCHNTHYATGSYAVLGDSRAGTLEQRRASALRTQMKSGSLKLIERRSFDGAEAYLLRGSTSTEATVTDGTPVNATRHWFELLVRTDTYEVIRTDERWYETRAGTEVQTSRKLLTQSPVRYLRTTELSTDLFKVHLPQTDFALSGSISATLAPVFDMRSLGTTRTLPPLYWIGQSLPDPTVPATDAPTVVAAGFVVGPADRINSNVMGTVDGAYGKEFALQTAASIDYANPKDPDHDVSGASLTIVTYPAGFKPFMLPELVQRRVIAGHPVIMETIQVRNPWTGYTYSMLENGFVVMPDAVIGFSSGSAMSIDFLERVIPLLRRANPPAATGSVEVSTSPGASAQPSKPAADSAAASRSVPASSP